MKAVTRVQWNKRTGRSQTCRCSVAPDSMTAGSASRRARPMGPLEGSADTLFHLVVLMASLAVLSDCGNRRLERVRTALVPGGNLHQGGAVILEVFHPLVEVGAVAPDLGPGLGVSTGRVVRERLVQQPGEKRHAARTLRYVDGFIACATLQHLAYRLEVAT